MSFIRIGLPFLALIAAIFFGRAAFPTPSSQARAARERQNRAAFSRDSNLLSIPHEQANEIVVRGGFPAHHPLSQGIHLIGDN